MKYKHFPQDTSHTSIPYYKNLVVCNYAIGGNILGGSIYSQVYRNTCFDHFPPRNPPPPKKKKKLPPHIGLIAMAMIMIIRQIHHYRDLLATPVPPLQIAWTPCVKRRDFQHELCFAWSQFWPK